MQVESVVFVSSRGDLAMGACTFGALLLALRSKGMDRSLVAGLAVGLDRGRCLADALDLGCAAGALACTREGAQASLPRPPAVEALMAGSEEV